jgi:hypothetical protein
MRVTKHPILAALKRSSVGYNFIITRRKSSFRKAFLENFTGYLLDKYSSIYVKILRGFLYTRFNSSKNSFYILILSTVKILEKYLTKHFRLLFVKIRVIEPFLSEIIHLLSEKWIFNVGFCYSKKLNSSWVFVSESVPFFVEWVEFISFLSVLYLFIPWIIRIINLVFSCVRYTCMQQNI